VTVLTTNLNTEEKRKHVNEWEVIQKFSDFYSGHLKLKNNPYLMHAARKGQLGARKLLKMVLSHNGASIPVNLEPFIEYLKCVVFQVDPEDYGLPYIGCTISVKELMLLRSELRDFVKRDSSCDYIIVVKPEELIGEERQRFVIAHELGHVFLRHIEIRSRIKSAMRFFRHMDSSKHDEFIRQKNIIEARQEVSANAFAGELLVPEVILKSFLFDKRINSINILSKIFKVSEPVVFIQACFIDSEHLLTL